MRKEAVAESKPSFCLGLASPRAFLNWLLRLLGIYLAIALIVVGSMLIGGLIIPLYSLLFSRPDIHKSRTIISRGVRLYLWILDLVGLLEVNYQGFEEISKGDAVVFVANHPSLWDVLFFIARYPNCSCIVKKNLHDFSPYSFCIRWAAYIVASRDDVVATAITELNQGNPVVIFPEGTRSDAAAQLEKGFHRGAAAIALRSGAKLYPVFINCDPPALGKNQAWYQIPDKKCLVNLSLQASIDVSTGNSENNALAARRITSGLEKLYSSL